MENKVKLKLKELNEDYDYWLEQYRNEELDFQDEMLKEINIKIRLLKSLLED